jgi:DNA-binding transcriptional regulator YiaG
MANNQQPQDINDFIQAVMIAANAAAQNAVAQLPPPAPPAPPQPVPPPQPPAPFALVPGRALIAPLDFSKSDDRKTFRNATTGLTSKFNMKEENLRSFLERVLEHVQNYDWQDIVQVPDGLGVARNLLTHYGQVTKEHVRAHAQGYVGTETRNAQNSIMLHQFLANSLTDEAHLIMISMKEENTINNESVGALYLKVLIGRSSIDTRAKVLLLRESISHLYVKMAEVKGNVRDFNQYVSEQVAALAGRGHTVDELVTHLFIAYSEVPDENFTRYIDSLRNRYDDEAEDYTATQLMALAVNKYNLLVQREALRSTDEKVERIVALETQIQSGKGKGKGRSNKRGKKGDHDTYAWKAVPPKAGEKTTKVVSGKTYNWCTAHKAWTIHTMAKCNLLKDQARSGSSNNRSPDGDQLVLNRAYQALVVDDDDEDSNE